MTADDEVQAGREEPNGRGAQVAAAVQLRSTLTCPHCGHQATEAMPTDFCQYVYDCPGCSAVLKPKPGDCCVYCSYGDAPCPPIQANGGAAGCGRETTP